MTMNNISMKTDADHTQATKITAEIKNNFNVDFYIQITGLSKSDALKHYLTTGWKEGLDPSPDFSTDKYLEAHADVKASGQNPYLHYFLFGKNEKRSVYPSQHSVGYAPATNALRSLDKPVITSEVTLDGLAEEHIKIINDEGLFSYSYYYKSYPDVFLSGQDGFSHYITHGWKENRNPSTNFDTMFYIKQYPDVTSCPLIHYVTSGIREKRLPISRHTISFSDSYIAKARNYKTDSRIAVHAHIYYTELGKEIIQSCNNIPYPYGLFITSTSQADADYLYNLAKSHSTAIEIQSICVPNRGRDIAPMIVGAKDIWSKYDYVCHVHSKKSLHTNFGERWRKYALDQLLGSELLISAIIKELDDTPTAGTIFPDNFLDIKSFVSWGKNLAPAQKLFGRMRLPSFLLEGTWEFPAGSMCWIRSKAIQPLLQVNFTESDFEPEESQVEGTLAHVIERSLIHISSSKGYDYFKYLAAPQDYQKITPATVTHELQQTPPAIHWQPQDPSISVNPRHKLSPLSIAFNPKHLNIHWIIPEYSEGLGGHTTIFRFVKYLEEFGHHQTVWILNPHMHADETEAKARIQEWFQNIGSNVVIRFLPKEVAGISGDVVISTDAWTVYPALAMPLFKDRFYFVQDHEPSFYPKGTNYHLIENTYTFGLKTLCAGAWLEGLMKNKYGNWTKKWYLAYDPEVYYPSVKGSTSERKLKIAFYSRATTPRRVVEIGLLALNLLYETNDDFEVHLFGNESPLAVEFPHVNHGIMKPKELGALYRDCDLGMVFSATNYSLIPIEMMACDLPVVEIDTESTRAVFTEDCVEFAKPDPLLLADTLRRLLSESSRRTELVMGGRLFIEEISWERSARIVEAGLIEGLAENYSSIDVVGLLAKPDTPLKASIIIPTYNAGPEFEAVLEKVVTQSTSWKYEVFVVDSGSTDETINIVKGFPQVKLHCIPNSEFQHGKTRNLAIELTEGEFIAVLTQDAEPADAHWLNNLVAAFDKSDKIGGVFGRHIAYPDATAFVKNDLIQHFEFYNEMPHVLSLNRGLPNLIPKQADQWQQVMHFFSDNNACIRRSVWQQVPYPEIEWGEDQTWAWEILKLGFEKAYAHDAVVYHSHTLSYEDQLKVSIEEGKFFARYFNYFPINNRDQMHLALDSRNHRDTIFASVEKLETDLLSERRSLNKAAVTGILIGSQTQKLSSKGVI